MSKEFLNQWGEAAYTTAGFFWSALWAFVLGYLISSMIQVFVTQERMKKSMGGAGAKEVGLATFFGFISSSCSFAALATTKSLFKKGAGFIPSQAFLLASTNLVIELGIVISIFLSWQFVVGEYAGGLLLIAFMWIFVKITKPHKLIKKTRERLSGNEHGHSNSSAPNWKQEIKRKSGWHKVGVQYAMEWDMVWKDVTVGFTVAGIIAAFVAPEFYSILFIGIENGNTDLSFLQTLEHVIVGPLAAFMTFIGSMGNIPLAGLLYANGVSFAGVMAFIFSDLVVFPVLRINAKYYGWKMSLYILLTLMIALTLTSLILHYGLSVFDMLPTFEGKSFAGQQYFKLNYTFYLNIAFLIISGALLWFRKNKPKDTGHHHGHEMPDKGMMDTILKILAYVSYAWLFIGLLIKFSN